MTYMANNEIIHKNDKHFPVNDHIGWIRKPHCLEEICSDEELLHDTQIKPPQPIDRLKVSRAFYTFSHFTSGFFPFF